MGDAASSVLSSDSVVLTAWDDVSQILAAVSASYSTLTRVLCMCSRNAAGVLKLEKCTRSTARGLVEFWPC